MKTLIIIVVIVLAIVVIRTIIIFFKDMSSSKKDFQGKPMKEVFSILIEYFNSGVFDGNVQIIENNLLNISLIHKVSSQHRVVMQYIKGALVITWSWKYLHQELNHKIRILDVLDVSEDKMLEITTELGKDMSTKMQKHVDTINQMDL